LNKSSDLLFDNEYQDNGIYNPELNDSDYVNAQNTSLWELHLLRVKQILIVLKLTSFLFIKFNFSSVITAKQFAKKQ
jgi:hypothetical protein